MDESAQRRVAGRRSHGLWGGVVMAALVVAVLVGRSCGGAHEAAEPESPQTAAPAPVAAHPAPARRPARAEPQAPTPSAPAAPAPEAPPADGSTGVRVEVVSEDGVRLRDGTVVFEGTDGIQIMNRGMSPLRYLKEQSLAAANPVVLEGLPDDADGLDVQAAAHVPGFPPAVARFKLRLHSVLTVRLVVPKGLTVDVRVVETDGETPVGGASVVSETETTRRKLDVAAVRGTPGPGSAVTDVAGRCTVGELSAGGHAFVVEAPEHERAQAEWTEGPLVVRMERTKGAGTVNVTVFGPDGKPAEGIVVEMMQSERKAKTGADGRVVFDAVPAGLRFFRLELPVDRADFHEWVEKTVAGMALLAQIEVEPGGRHDVELGVRPGGATFEARLVSEDGTPIVGVEVSAMADIAILARQTTGADGVVRFAGLAPCKLDASVELEPGTRWHFAAVDVAAHERVAKTWTLGTTALRGRVVHGAEKTGVRGAEVAAVGPLLGFTGTTDDGRFELPRAPAGTYRVSVTLSGGFASRPVDVVVPSEKEVVLELVECGRVAVRFAASDRALLRDAKIDVRSTSGAPEPSRARDAGEYDGVWTDALPGGYEVVVELAGRTRSFQAEVKSGATTVVEVRAP